MSFRKITLRLNANVNRYRVTLQTGRGSIVKEVYTKTDCLTLCADCPCLKIYARALEEGYPTSYYYRLDAQCSSCFDLYFNFQRAQTAPLTTNIFTLTDENYGLPINGELYFFTS